MKKHNLNIILLGDPAAGKTSHAKRLAKQYHLVDFGMGRELRKIERRARIEKRFHLKKRLDRGMLGQTSLVRDILIQKMKSIPLNRGILFDGHPKMLGEARLLVQLLKAQKRADPIVIYLTIPRREILSRMNIRGRGDDTELAFKNREKYYRRHVRAVVVFYKRLYPFVKISSHTSSSEVAKRITLFINQHR